MKIEELRDALMNLGITEAEAQVLAESAYTDEKLGDAILWGIKKFGDKAPTLPTEVKSMAQIEGITYFQAVARLAK